jgi:hypothetical protein
VGFFHLFGGLISEEENIAHGKDILPFQLDFPHMRFERDEAGCVSSPQIFSYWGTHPECVLALSRLRPPAQTGSVRNVFISRSCNFFAMLPGTLIAWSSTPKFPAWNEGVTRRYDVLEQAEPAEGDQQASNGLKHCWEFGRISLPFRPSLEEVSIGGFRRGTVVNPTGTSSFASIVFRMSAHTGLRLQELCWFPGGTGTFDPPKFQLETKVSLLFLAAVRSCRPEKKLKRVI